MQTTELTTLQIEFLELLPKHGGIVDHTLATMGLERSSYFNWKRNEVFDHHYRLVITEITTNLDAEIGLLVKQRRAQILRDGIVEETETLNTTVSSTGKVKTTSKKVIKRTSPPPNLLENGDSRLIKALQTLVQENVLSIAQARKLASRCSQLPTDLRTIFEESDGTLEKQEDEKVIALIKAAVLGN